MRDYEALLVVANLVIVDVAGCRILQHEWATYLKSCHFVILEVKDNPRAPCLDTKRTDFQAHIEGRAVSKDRPKRVYVHAVRIGAEVPNRTVHSSLLVQKDANGKLIQIAPRLRNLKAKQREFARTVVLLLFKAIYHIPLLYERFMADEPPTSQTPAKQLVRSPVPEPQARLGIDLVGISTRQANNVSPLTKKARLGIDLVGTPTRQAPPGNIIPTPSPTTQATSNDIDRSKFPMLADFKDMIGNKYKDTSWDLLFIELTKMLKDGSVVTATDSRSHKKSWVHMPVDSTDASHGRRAKEWLGKALDINASIDDNQFNSAHRACNYLAINHPDSMTASLKDKQYPVVEHMNETRLAAIDPLCRCQNWKMVVSS